MSYNKMANTEVVKIPVPSKKIQQLTLHFAQLLLTFFCSWGIGYFESGKKTRLEFKSGK